MMGGLSLPRTGVSTGVPREEGQATYDGCASVSSQGQMIFGSFITSLIISMAALFVSGDSLAYL